MRLIINGSRLEGATATVGGRVCNVSSATQMECLLPAGVGQSVTVTVTNDHGQIGTARLLSYALPVVYNISGCGAVATSTREPVSFPRRARWPTNWGATRMDSRQRKMQQGATMQAGKQERERPA